MKCKYIGTYWPELTGKFGTIDLDESDEYVFGYMILRIKNDDGSESSIYVDNSEIQEDK